MLMPFLPSYLFLTHSSLRHPSRSRPPLTYPSPLLSLPPSSYSCPSFPFLSFPLLIFNSFLPSSSSLPPSFQSSISFSLFFPSPYIRVSPFLFFPLLNSFLPLSLLPTSYSYLSFRSLFITLSPLRRCPRSLPPLTHGHKHHTPERFPSLPHRLTCPLGSSP